jgi:hypothetical protein
MSRKQEIYKDILSWALPSARNCLSHFRRPRLIVLLSPKDQKWLRYHYELAECVHNLYVSLLEAEFTDHDIHFLNYQARSFFERHGKDDPVYAYYIQELFKEVPEHMRGKLMWAGPEEDYSWARPRTGWELGL